jgi:hypothetical protein
MNILLAATSAKLAEQVASCRVWIASSSIAIAGY